MEDALNSQFSKVVDAAGDLEGFEIAMGKFITLALTDRVSVLILSEQSYVNNLCDYTGRCIRSIIRDAHNEALKARDVFTFAKEFACSLPVIQKNLVKNIPLGSCLEFCKAQSPEDASLICDCLAHIYIGNLSEIEIDELKESAPILLELLEVAEVQPLALALAGSLSQLNAFRAAFISDPKYAEFKARMNEFTSCDDHLTVVSSLVMASFLFPRSFNLETALLAAFHSISTSNTNILLLNEALLLIGFVNSIHPLSRENILSLCDFINLFEGMKCWLLLKCLELVVVAVTNFDGFPVIDLYTKALRSPTWIASLIIDICRPLPVVVEDVDGNLTKTALKNLTLDADQTENAAFILKVLSDCDSNNQIDKECVKNALVRAIENGESRSSILLFLAAFHLTRDDYQLKKDLRLCIIETSFTTLLSMELIQGTSRILLADAFEALAAVLSLEPTINSKVSIIQDSLVAGFLSVNLSKAKQIEEAGSARAVRIQELETENSELRVRSELADHELETLYGEIEALEHENKSLSGELEGFKELTEKSSQESSTTRTHLETANSQLDDLRAQNKALMDQLTEVKHENETSQRLVGELREVVQKIEAMETQKSEAEKTVAKITSQNEELTRRLKETTEALQTANDLLQKSKGKRKTLKSDFEQHSAEFAQLESEKEKHKSNINALQARIVELQNTIEQQLTKNRALKDKIKELVGVIDEMKITEESLQRAVAAQERRCEELTQSLQSYQAHAEEWDMVRQFLHTISSDTSNVPVSHLLAMVESEN